VAPFIRREPPFEDNMRDPAHSSHLGQVYTGIKPSVAVEAAYG
jgi:hypothetical protein